MKGSSKVIIGATPVMVVSIVIVLGLVLVLLAELYCSFLLLRRRQLRASTSNITTSSNVAATINDTSQQHGHQDHSENLSLSSFCSQGVLHAPRNLLFPAVPGDQISNEDLEKQQHSPFPKFCESPTQQHTSTSPHHLRKHVFLPPSSRSFVPLPPPRLVYDFPLQCSTSTYNDEACGGSNMETYIYICNPVYDNDASRPSRVETLFETPDSSPSRLEINGSGEDDNDIIQSPTTSTPSSQAMIVTPPLTPMKKLPAEACSISLRDAGSLATSGSDSNNEGISSSSTSESPCTSPSW
ncbi:hypothetical protein ACH5RR_005958 [Cinchona calisaya]|uniref:Uncharacterized protein n=1 Tax=Cinchona calisaya TaxID=153742 RepID=A0ABD3AMT2_9GENT